MQSSTTFTPDSSASPNGSALPATARWDLPQGQGPLAHFYHANGFAPGVYLPLMNRLRSSLTLGALHMRPTWPDAGSPTVHQGWQPYADDLIAHIEQTYSGPIVGIGHSMGATSTALAAQKRPDLFKAVVLIEPPMLSRPLALVTRWLPSVVVRRNPLIRSTLARRDRWASREEFLQHCQRSRVYQHFGPEALAALAKAGVREVPGGGVELAFPKAWEAHNYMQPPHILRTLGQLKVPCVAIRGKPSAFFSQNIWQGWQAASPSTVFLEDLNHGHLLPLENPQHCADLIHTGLAQLL